MTKEQEDVVKKPKHYQSPFPVTVELADGETVHVDGKRKDYYHFYISVKDVVRAWGLQYDAWLFNVLKYVLRAGRKGDSKEKELQDLKKAQEYLGYKIEDLEANLKDQRFDD